MTFDVHETIRAAQVKRIKRNDLVVRVARLIDPGAFTVWYSSTGPDAPAIEPDARTRYAQAMAITKAEQILQFAAKVPNLAERLIDEEMVAWEDLSPTLRSLWSGETRQSIAEKHRRNGAELLAQSEDVSERHYYRPRLP